MLDSDLRQKLEKSLEALHVDLRGLRVGRANPGMVADIEIDAYNSQMPLEQVASIATPQNNQIFIQPWDAGLLNAVYQGIQKSGRQLNPSLEVNGVRITLPPLTEETRKNLAKEIQNFSESARIAIRNIREEAIKDVEDAEKNKEISEDEKFRQKEQIQKMVDEYNTKVQEAGEKKREEILEI